MFNFSKDLTSTLVAANNKDEWSEAFKEALRSGKHVFFGEKPTRSLGLRFESTKIQNSSSFGSHCHTDDLLDRWPYAHPSFRPHRSVFAMLNAEQHRLLFGDAVKFLTKQDNKKEKAICEMPPIMPFEKSIFPGPSVPYKRTFPWGFVPTTPFGGGR